MARQSATRVCEPGDDAVADVAYALVAAGRVVPGLSVEADGRSRSWWWPLPAASHRSLVATLVVDPSVDGQRRAAARLAEAVDATVRTRLATANVVLTPKRGGRPAVADAWARSLVSADPWLLPTLDPAKVGALAEAVKAWVRTGAVIQGQARLFLRVREPTRGDRWSVELLAQDRDEPSLVLPLADVWAGRSPFGPSVLEDMLASLGRMVRLAPELGAVLHEAAPNALDLDGSSVLRILRDRVGALDDAGIGVLLPSWWTHRPRLGLRARVKKAMTSSAVVAGGLGIDAIVDFSWEAALADQQLTKADLAALTRAVDAKRSLVRLRGQWVEIDPIEVGTLLQAVGTTGQASAHDVLRAGMGLDQLGIADAVEVVGVDASAVTWISSLLDDALHATVEPVPTPE
ncbi:MAG: SNF2 helicase-associated domain-containing protein, partial [Actinomycetota bacterium]|nr:SNF2 helicase-associated domain-containing protein [Actinomycetota bacterium]